MSSGSFTFPQPVDLFLSLILQCRSNSYELSVKYWISSVKSNSEHFVKWQHPAPDKDSNQGIAGCSSF